MLIMRWQHAVPLWCVVVMLALIADADAAGLPTLRLAQTDYTLVYFRSPFVHPQPAMRLTLTNASFISVMTPNCTRAWQTAIVGLRDAAWDARLVDSLSVVSATEAVLYLSPQLTFWVPDTNTYTLVVPDECRAPSNASSLLEPVIFTITNGLRSQAGRVFTYIYLVAGCSAVLATLGGTITALQPPQLAAVIASSGCGPTQLQDEYEVLRWLLVPFELPSYYADEKSDFYLAAFSLALLVVAAFMELAHVIARLALTNTYWTHLSSYLAANAKRGGQSPGRQREKEEADAAADPSKFWAGHLPLPPLIFCCWLVGLFIGVARYSLRTLLTLDGNVVTLIAFVGCVACALGFPIISFAATRMRTARYHSYQASKGKIPPWMQPSGVWGPNFYRLSLGIFFEDFRPGMRSFGSGLTCVSIVIALAMGNVPTSVSGCRNQLWLLTFVTCSFTGVMYTLRPFRSKFYNHVNIISYGLLSLYVLMLLLQSGYFYDDVDHWSHNGIFFAGMLHGACCTVSSVGLLLAAYWEAFGRNAVKTANGEFGRMHDGHGGRTAMLENVAPEVQIAAERSEAARNADERLDADSKAMFNEMLAFYAAHPPDDVLDNAAGGVEGGGLAGAARERDGGPQSLASYLLQDFEALPDTTREDMVLWERLAKEDRERRSQMMPNMVIHPSRWPQIKSLDGYTHRERPPVDTRFLL